MKNNLLWLSVAVLFFTIGCKHQGPITPTAGIIDSLGTQGVCFESDVMPIFINYCSQSGCHGNGSKASGILTDNYDEIMKKITPGNPSKSKNYTIIINGEMPVLPVSHFPNVEQVKTIEKWILDGALNTIQCDTNTVYDTLNVTYSNHVAPIMSKYCSGCHSGNPPQGRIDLTTYTSVKAELDLGRLWGSFNWDIGYSRMPKGGIKLADYELAQIKKWIDNGALNN